MPDEPNSSPADAPAGDEEGTGSVVTFPRERSVDRPSHNLPLELTSFVGREREIEEAKGLLEGTRLLTLTGAGGSGKTRLALRVAGDLVGEYEDGVWLVELAPLSDPALVGQAVARVLGVREQPDRPIDATLVDALRSKELLVVLDNCEHLVDAAARLVETMLLSCPHLRVLATSREALGVGGEVNRTVPALSVPGTHVSAEELEGYESVRLFVERAQAVVVDFALTEQNAVAVARLCDQLDGTPLAIELAAARTRVLTVEQISDRLEDPLSLLTTGSRTAAPRHQTLRATLQWSYDLLNEAERALFCRLSVFVGGWNLEAAEVVGGPEEAERVLDLLSALVDKSLVVAEAETEGARRHRMLEPIRQFGHEKLEESTEAPEVRRRHAGHYLAFAERAEPGLLGADQGLWLGRLRTELGNLRGALAWSLESDQQECPELRLRLVAALGRFWGREDFEEGKWWLRTALERDPGGFPVARAKALAELGFILLFQQNYGTAIAALDEAVALYKELGDRTGAAFALANLGWAVLHGYYRERVLAFVREGETLIESGLEDPPRAYLSIILAAATVWQGDLDLAASRIKESLAMSRALGNLWNVAMALFNLGGIHLRRGDTERAMEAFEEGARISGQLGDMLGAAYYVWIYGGMNARMGRPIRAARLWGAAEALREQMGMSFSKYDLAESGYEGDLAAVRSTLSEAAFEAAWAEGRAMSPEQAIEHALGAVEEPAAAQPATASPPVAPEQEAGTSEKPMEMTEAEIATTTTAGLRIFALGPARVERGERTLSSSEYGYAKPRELLFYLLSYPEGRTKGQIGLDLWPEASPSRLRGNLHEALRRLRKALGGSEWIFHRGGRYFFERSLPYSFDVEAFEGNLAVAAAATGGPEYEAPEGRQRAISNLEGAVALYGGEYLEEFLDWEWAMERREELARKHQQALLSLGGLLLDEGSHEQAAEVYRKAITHDSYLEAAHRGLMRSYAAMGERGTALEHYHSVVGVLGEGLGTEPAPETRELYEELRKDM